MTIRNDLPSPHLARGWRLRGHIHTGGDHGEDGDGRQYAPQYFFVSAAAGGTPVAQHDPVVVRMSEALVALISMILLFWLLMDI